MAIFRTDNVRADFNEWDEQSGVVCCICGKKIEDAEAICWRGDYCHEDADCSYELWQKTIKEYLKERVE